MSKKKTAHEKPFYKKWWFWLIAVLILGSFAQNTDPDRGANPPDSTKSPNETTMQTDPTKQPTVVPTTAHAVSPKSILTDFIDQYNSVSQLPVDGITAMDIQGDDYRTEFRLNAFEDAVGQKGTFSGGTMQVVIYGTWELDQIRIYAYADTYEAAAEVAGAVIGILGPELSPDEIAKVLEEPGNISLGDRYYITGYINADYANGGIAGYEIMIDASKILF